MPAYNTPLPLPGEYIIVQLNPLEMVKHLKVAGLKNSLSKLAPKKYMAVLYKYLEEISPSKPWHLCQLHLYYDFEPPSGPSTATTVPSEIDDSSGSAVVPNDMDEEKRPIPSHKGRKKIQTIVARIRTRLCTLPRGNVCRVPDETWANMCRTFLIMRRREHMRDLPSHVDCYHHVLIRAPHPPITPFQSDVLQTDQAELTSGEMHLRLCLVPHFDYSFNLNIGVSCGKHLLAEHTFVVSTLVSAIPNMPLRTLIPTNPIGITIFEDGGSELSKVGRIPVSRFSQRPQSMDALSEILTLMVSAEEYERPRDFIIVFAPPAVLSQAQSAHEDSVSLRHFLALQFIKISRILFMCTRPILRRRLYPENRYPYIPFETWEKFAAAYSDMATDEPDSSEAETSLVLEVNPQSE